MGGSGGPSLRHARAPGSLAPPLLAVLVLVRSACWCWLARGGGLFAGVGAGAGLWCDLEGAGLSQGPDGGAKGAWLGFAAAPLARAKGDDVGPQSLPRLEQLRRRQHLRGPCKPAKPRRPNRQTEGRRKLRCCLPAARALDHVRGAQHEASALTALVRCVRRVSAAPSLPTANARQSTR